ncbi:MAG: choloylglycine hydrolase family protein [bacterium]|nr:choloylglycine hydrolase family protein [bacterium]
MCTGFILKTENGSPLFSRTLEWGMNDLESELVKVPRNLKMITELGYGKKGMTWNTKYGFIGINFNHMTYYIDGMNEVGLSIGAFYFPGFSEYQQMKTGDESISLNSADLVSYILGNYKSVNEIKNELPKIRVIYNKEFEEIFGAPYSLHFTATDDSGKAIVIEYINGELHILDNTIGVMTNSPSYDWHQLNLRNCTNLTPYAGYSDEKEMGGVNITPFGVGSGMLGLPGDYTPVSRFVRASFFVHTSIPLKDTETALKQASAILNNFDIPKGIARAGTPDHYYINFTQWSSIADLKNRHYYWWTESNKQKRRVDLHKINFECNCTSSVPLDKVLSENIDDRTKEL